MTNTTRREAVGLIGTAVAFVLAGVPTLPAQASTPEPELRDLLERAHPFYMDADGRDGECECATCAPLRAKPFACLLCGFVARPDATAYVHPCSCHYYEALVDGTEVGPCPAASPETMCAHDARSCPVCWSPEGARAANGDGDEESNHPWELIADLRGALAARGLV